MDDFNCSIRESQTDRQTVVPKPHPFDVRKHCNSESCNYAEKTSNKGKSCNREENKYMDIWETNNLEILNGKFGSDSRGEFIFTNNSEVAGGLWTADKYINN